MPFGYKDLVSTPHLRTQTIAIDGLGDVKIHELSANEVWSISEQQTKSEKEVELFKKTNGEQGTDKGLSPDFYARVALKGLSESKGDIPDSDVQAFISNIGQSVIIQIFNHIIRYNHITKQSDAIDDLQKN